MLPGWYGFRGLRSAREQGRHRQQDQRNRSLGHDKMLAESLGPGLDLEMEPGASRPDCAACRISPCPSLRARPDAGAHRWGSRCPSARQAVTLARHTGLHDHNSNVALLN